MSTRHVILALLDVQPSTGYELAQRESISTEPVWSATHSQIYPALHKLEEDGLVESEDAVRGRKLRRVVYRITDAGRAELRRWQEEPVKYLPFRDPFRLWTAFVDAVTPKTAYRNVDEHLRRHAELVTRMDRASSDYAAGRHPNVEARKGTIDADRLDRIKRSRAAMYAELAALARAEIESALRVRALVAELHPDVEPPPLPLEVEDALVSS